MLQPGERVLGDDISYALNVFPNHHRALIAITRLADRLRTERPPSLGPLMSGTSSTVANLVANSGMRGLLSSMMTGMCPKFKARITEIACAARQIK